MKRAHLSSLLCALLVLSACQPRPEPRPSETAGPLLLRAVYRDAASTMVLVIPEAGQPKTQTGDCTAPILIDSLTGQARVLSAAEAQARLKTMQLAGATRGACPRR